MLSEDWLQMYLYRLVGQFPSLTMIGVGFVLALRMLPKHPRPAWALIAALCVASFNNVGMPMLMQQITELFGRPSGGSGLWMALYVLPYSVVAAVSWGLIFFAVFDRPTEPKFLQEENEDDTSAR